MAKQITIYCSKCGKIKRVRPDNFLKTSDEWTTCGNAFYCQECSKAITRKSGRDNTIENMVWLFAHWER